MKSQGSLYYLARISIFSGENDQTMSAFGQFSVSSNYEETTRYSFKLSKVYRSSKTPI